LKRPETTGKCLGIRDDIDTDAIIPGKYLTINKPDELARHAFEGVRPEFAHGVKEGILLLQVLISDAVHRESMRLWH